MTRSVGSVFDDHGRRLALWLGIRFGLGSGGLFLLRGGRLGDALRAGSWVRN